MKIETIAVHAGRKIDPATGAVMSPIHLSTTFERHGDGSYTDDFVYTRSDNPNRRALEEALAQLEGGRVAAAFGSGQAATMSVMQCLSAGDHLIIPDDTYFGTRGLASGEFSRWGIEVSSVDMTDLDQFRATIQPNTKLVWIETPSNPLLKITDIAAVVDVAHRAGARVVVDNTWPSPMGQQPLSLGADLVMHATTKYLGGHSDLLGGAVIGRVEDDFFTQLRQIQQLGGAVPSPFDCWLLLRSIRTLPYRVRAHSEGAMRVATYLATHPRVAVVHYPGLSSHAGHEVAARQMQLYGGMMSIQLDYAEGDADQGAAAAMAVAALVKLFTRATSLGGIESLIEHRYSVEGSDSPTPRNLLRLSVGLEHPDDLIADLAQALDHDSAR